jgi:hypothetical protein
MNDLKQQLINIEEEFNLLKAKIERNHIIFIILYFLPPVLAILVFTKYVEEYFSNLIKGFILGLIILGVAIHYFLRYVYHKSKNRYKKFIDAKLEVIKSDFNDEELFKKEIIEAARNIFIERGVLFNNKSIKISNFWNLIFINLGLHIDEDDTND